MSAQYVTTAIFLYHYDVTVVVNEVTVIVYDVTVVVNDVTVIVFDAIVVIYDATLVGYDVTVVCHSSSIRRRNSDICDCNTNCNFIHLAIQFETKKIGFKVFRFDYSSILLHNDSISKF